MNKINRLTSNCENCVHYYIDYYTPGMPASCRSLNIAINNLNISHCCYFMEKTKNFILPEEENDLLDSFIKRFNN